MDDSGVTCIRLAPVVYALLSKLFVRAGRTLAIVADDGQATLDGGGSVGPMLTSLEGADVVLANLRLRNGNGTHCCGGAIYNEGTMTMQACAFDGNNVDYGGAVYNWKGTMEMHACTFDGNRAEQDGGAVYNYQGTMMEMQACAFDRNHAKQHGGAVYNYDSTMAVHGCNFTNCSAEVLLLPRSAISLRRHPRLSF